MSSKPPNLYLRGAARVCWVCLLSPAPSSALQHSRRRAGRPADVKLNAMKILLPPSEGKMAPTSGAQLNWEKLTFSQLTQIRQRVAAELQQVSGREDALTILKVGASLSAQVRQQTHLMELPCAPAWQVYTGVLYEAMDLPRLFTGSENHAEAQDGAAATESAAKRAHTATDATTAAELAGEDALIRAATDIVHRAERQIVVFSALFGVHSITDLIPAYRLAMGVRLPTVGNTATLWKRALATMPIAENELVVDCRSEAYQVWTPPAGADWVQVRAVREHSGKRTVVSHNAKRYRGLLAGELLRTQSVPRDAEELADYAQALVGKAGVIAVELDAPAGGVSRRAITPRPWILTIVERS